MRKNGAIPYRWVSDASRRAHYTDTFSGAGDFLWRYASVYRADCGKILATITLKCGPNLDPWQVYSRMIAASWRSPRDSLAGVLIDRKIEQGLRKHLGADFPLHFERVAINREQIDRYNLSTKPRKTSDRRRLDIQQTVEAEVMPEKTMRALVRDKIESYLEPGALAVARIAVESERELMGEIANLIDYDRGELEHFISQN